MPRDTKLVGILVSFVQQMDQLNKELGLIDEDLRKVEVSKRFDFVFVCMYRR